MLPNTAIIIDHTMNFDRSSATSSPDKDGDLCLGDMGDTASIDGGGAEIKGEVVVPTAMPPGPGGIALRAEERKRRKALTEQERRSRRVVSNRKAAKVSRDHRRRLLQELPAKVEMLREENQSLAQVNAELTAQVQDLRNQLPLVLNSLAAASGVSPTQHREQQEQGFQQQQAAEVSQYQLQMAGLHFGANRPSPGRQQTDDDAVDLADLLSDDRKEDFVYGEWHTKEGR